MLVPDDRLGHFQEYFPFFCTLCMNSWHVCFGMVHKACSTNTIVDDKSQCVWEIQTGDLVFLVCYLNIATANTAGLLILSKRTWTFGTKSDKHTYCVAKRETESHQWELFIHFRWLSEHKLTVRKEANPHQDFSSRLQYLYSLQRKTEASFKQHSSSLCTNDTFENKSFLYARVLTIMTEITTRIKNEFLAFLTCPNGIFLMMKEIHKEN